MARVGLVAAHVGEKVARKVAGPQYLLFRDMVLMPPRRVSLHLYFDLAACNCGDARPLLEGFLRLRNTRGLLELISLGCYWSLT